MRHCFSIEKSKIELTYFGCNKKYKKLKTITEFKEENFSVSDALLKIKLLIEGDYVKLDNRWRKIIIKSGRPMAQIFLKKWFSSEEFIIPYNGSCSELSIEYFSPPPLPKCTHGKHSWVIRKEHGFGKAGRKLCKNGSFVFRNHCSKCFIVAEYLERDEFKRGALTRLRGLYFKRILKSEAEGFPIISKKLNTRLPFESQIGVEGPYEYFEKNKPLFNYYC